MRFIILLMLCGLAGAYTNTYYLDVAVGDDSNAGTSAGAGNAWQNIEKALETVAANDRVYVKASGEYTDQDDATSSVGDIITPGAANTPIAFIGYHTTPGDGGIVILDASDNTLDYVMISSYSGNIFYVFENFYFKDSQTGAGFSTTTADNIIFKNCIFEGNAAQGALVDDYAVFFNCVFTNNGGNGIEGDSVIQAVNSASYSNGNIGFYVDTGVIVNCIAYNNTSHDYRFNGFVPPCILINCLSDGENQTSDYGYWQDQAAHFGDILINNIFYDADYGIYADGDAQDGVISYFNSHYSNANPPNNWLAPSTGDGVGDRGDVTGDPAFVNEGADDYSLGATSAAKATGADWGWALSFWTDYNLGAGDNPVDSATVGYVDIGPIQREESGGNPRTGIGAGILK